MKQGTANSSGAGSRKVEPKSHPISPKVAAGIGIQTIRTEKVKKDPHGFLAPPVKLKGYNGGSQGSY